MEAAVPGVTFRQLCTSIALANMHFASNIPVATGEATWSYWSFLYYHLQSLQYLGTKGKDTIDTAMESKRGTQVLLAVHVVSDIACYPSRGYDLSSTKASLNGCSSPQTAMQLLTLYMLKLWHELSWCNWWPKNGQKILGFHQLWLQTYLAVLHWVHISTGYEWDWVRSSLDVSGNLKQPSIQEP